MVSSSTTPAAGRPGPQDAATASTVLLRLSDLPSDWSEVGGVATLTGADLEFDRACMPSTRGHGCVHAVGRRLAYLAAPVGPAPPEVYHTAPEDTDPDDHITELVWLLEN